MRLLGRALTVEFTNVVCGIRMFGIGADVGGATLCGAETIKYCSGRGGNNGGGGTVIGGCVPTTLTGGKTNGCGSIGGTLGGGAGLWR